LSGRGEWGERGEYEKVGLVNQSDELFVKTVTSQGKYTSGRPGNVKEIFPISDNVREKWEKFIMDI